MFHNRQACGQERFCQGRVLSERRVATRDSGGVLQRRGPEYTRRRDSEGVCRLTSVWQPETRWRALAKRQASRQASVGAQDTRSRACGSCKAAVSSVAIKVSKMVLVAKEKGFLLQKDTRRRELARREVRGHETLNVSLSNRRNRLPTVGPEPQQRLCKGIMREASKIRVLGRKHVTGAWSHKPPREMCLLTWAMVTHAQEKLRVSRTESICTRHACDPRESVDA